MTMELHSGNSSENVCSDSKNSDLRGDVPVPLEETQVEADAPQINDAPQPLGGSRVLVNNLSR